MNEELSNQTDNTQDQSDYFQNVDTLGNAVSLSDIPSTQPDISSNVEVPQKFNILTGEPERSLSDTFPIPKEKLKLMLQKHFKIISIHHIKYHPIAEPAADYVYNFILKPKK